MHCVARQNKLETPKEKDEVNKREVHECDVRTCDPDSMVSHRHPSRHAKPKPSPGHLLLAAKEGIPSVANPE